MLALDDATAKLVDAVSANHIQAVLWSKSGWPVFPLLPGDKVPYPGTHGVLEATRNISQITRWWMEHPDANIGGACMGRIVIDLDAYKPEHPDELASLRADGLELPPTRTHRARGVHLIYRDTTKLPPEQVRGKLASTIDVKHGPGQYIVLPPSLHPSGERYRVTTGRRPEAAVPDGLRAFVEKQPGPAALDDVPEALPLPDKLPRNLRKALATQQADRSDHSFHVACAAYRAGLSDGQVVTLLEQDETTQERWNEKPHKRFLELTDMLPRAKEEAEQESNPGGPPTAPPSSAPDDRWPTLPDEFWETRPVLAHIRQAARSRRAGPEAFLLHTFAGSHCSPTRGTRGRMARPSICRA